MQPSGTLDTKFLDTNFRQQSALARTTLQRLILVANRYQDQPLQCSLRQMCRLSVIGIQEFGIEGTQWLHNIPLLVSGRRPLYDSQILINTTIMKTDEEYAEVIIGPDLRH